MPIGAGRSAAGSSLAGYGTPDTAPVMSRVILPDPVTGLPQSGRGLGVGGVYTFTPDGRIQGFSRVPALVQLALATGLGTSVSGTLGIDWSKIREIGPGIRSQIQNIVTKAFAPIVSQKLATLVSVHVTTSDSTPNQIRGIAPGRDGVIITVRWTDLTTSQEHNTVVGNSLSGPGVATR